VPGLTLTPVVYPRAKPKEFAFSDKPVLVFEGRTVLRLTARAGAGLPAGSHVLSGKLTLQACEGRACLPPRTVGVEVRIEVVE
jgi:hypothetical protein